MEVAGAKAPATCYLEGRLPPPGVGCDELQEHGVFRGLVGRLRQILKRAPVPPLRAWPRRLEDVHKGPLGKLPGGWLGSTLPGLALPVATGFPLGALEGEATAELEAPGLVDAAPLWQPVATSARAMRSRAYLKSSLSRPLGWFNGADVGAGLVVWKWLSEVVNATTPRRDDARSFYLCLTPERARWYTPPSWLLGGRDWYAPIESPRRPDTDGNNARVFD